MVSYRGNAGVAVFCLQAVKNLTVGKARILNNLRMGKHTVKQIASHLRDHVVDLNEHGVAGDLDEHVVEIVVRLNILVDRVLFIEHIDQLLDLIILLGRHAVVDGGDIADLDHAAQFYEILAVLLAGEKAHELKEIACHIVGDERALALTGLDHAVGREDLDALAQRRTADVQLLGKIGFDGQAVAHLQLAPLDLVANIVDN